MTPCLIAGFDAADEPVFLWPFVRDRFGPFRIATFFGGKHATINMALWRRDVADTFTAADMRGVLARRQPAMAGDLDFLLLFNQPYRWSDAANPFALLPKHRSTEDNFVLRLGGTSAEILERELSSSTRSRLRNKEKKLQKLKDYRYVRAKTAQEVDFQLASFFTQKAEKFAALGLHNVFADPGIEDFIRAACHEGLDSRQAGDRIACARRRRRDAGAVLRHPRQPALHVEFQFAYRQRQCAPFAGADPASASGCRLRGSRLFLVRYRARRSALQVVVLQGPRADFRQRVAAIRARSRGGDSVAADVPDEKRDQAQPALVDGRFIRASR